MKADITRNTFDQFKHYSRVMMQQGRVQLDADWNEQASIMLHLLRTVVRDIVGPYAAPAGHAGFRLVMGANTAKGDFDITPGRMYVNGILVENDEQGATYLTQPDLPKPPTLQQGTNYGVYLDVWERHITSLQDPNIREVALGGPDTATRTKVTWQVKTWTAESPAYGESCDSLLQKLSESLDKIQQYRTQLADPTSSDQATLRGEIANLRSEIADVRRKLAGCGGDGWCLAVQGLSSTSDAGLKARVEPSEPSKDPCIQAPASQYRGAANQLYRVEIHRGGIGMSPDMDEADDSIATFKWSRDNGSLATALLGVQTQELTVQSARGFAANGWVEVSEPNLDLLQEPGVLLRLVTVEGNTLTYSDGNSSGIDLRQATMVRSWGQQASGDQELVDGAVPVIEGEWLSLENGIQVWFDPGGEYKTGDYWLIPARVVGGVIEWPVDENGDPGSMPPDGITHYYAPLGVIEFGRGTWTIGDQCNCEFSPINDCAKYGYGYGGDTGIGTDQL